MQTPASNIWWPRGASFVFAALAAASASFWALKVSVVNTATNVAVAATAGPVVIDAGSVIRALGGSLGASSAEAPPASLDTRFAMLGVVADLHSAGTALISVDGKRAKPYRVGDAVEDGLILQSVQGRKAALGSTPGAATVLTLELPALPQ